MRLIAHRGNINGITKDENNPDYVYEAIKQGFDVEVDLRVFRDKLYLGHDEPQYEITLSLLQAMSKNLWVHCKDVDALHKLVASEVHYFWHQEDDYTLTSGGFVWVYPNKRLIKNSICVLPENGYNGNIEECYAICTDIPLAWSKDV